MALLSQIPSIAENVGGWSTFLLAWLGVLAFFGALLGVAQTRQDGKRARTLDYLRRLYSQEFAPLNAQVMAFVRTGDTGMFAHGAHFEPDVIVSGEAVEAAFYRLDIEHQSRVNLVLNFYEELSCSCREGLLDKEVAEKMLVPAVETMWERAEPFITQLRVSAAEALKANPEKPPESVKPEELMEEWEQLINVLRERQKKEREETESPGKTRAWADTAQRALRFDGPVVRWAGMVAAALVVAGLVVIGVVAT